MLWIKRVALGFFIVFIASSFIGEAHAFLYEIKVLDKSAIRSLSKAALLDAYIDVEIELNASKAFHDAAGFNNPREFKKYKALLRYRYDLLEEIRKRELDIPKIEP